jgi:hypothetical protein
MFHIPLLPFQCCNQETVSRFLECSLRFWEGEAPAESINHAVRQKSHPPALSAIYRVDAMSYAHPQQRKYDWEGEAPAEPINRAVRQESHPPTLNAIFVAVLMSTSSHTMMKIRAELQAGMPALPGYFRSRPSILFCQTSGGENNNYLMFVTFQFLLLVKV